MNHQLHPFTLFLTKKWFAISSWRYEEVFFSPTSKEPWLSLSRSFLFNASIFLSRITRVKFALRDLGGLWPSYFQFKDWIILYKKQNFRFLGPSELLNIPFITCEWCDSCETLLYQVNDHVIEVMFFFFLAGSQFSLFTRFLRRFLEFPSVKFISLYLT